MLHVTWEYTYTINYLFLSVPKYINLPIRCITSQFSLWSLINTCSNAKQQRWGKESQMWSHCRTYASILQRKWKKNHFQKECLNMYSLFLVEKKPMKSMKLALRACLVFTGLTLVIFSWPFLLITLKNQQILVTFRKYPTPKTPGKTLVFSSGRFQAVKLYFDGIFWKK